ncbi:hypothetical protein EG68_11966 [Paragonimus skrjabini miyazakii]|uniref:Uncharacterized protein n=1 Tax=Paragonimus skrjabini miyazakii TaxID=59628 RepID=A0A8S9YD74_9TREM|nr:hypothetical protein EG68_11966 [Paragonimus skrjabini miyazakii]
MKCIWNSHLIGYASSLRPDELINHGSVLQIIENEAVFNLQQTEINVSGWSCGTNNSDWLTAVYLGGSTDLGLHSINTETFRGLITLTTTSNSPHNLCGMFKMLSMSTLVKICILLIIVAIGHTLTQQTEPCAYYRRCRLDNGNNGKCDFAQRLCRASQK